MHRMYLVVSLCANNVCLLLLLGLFDEESGALSLLLCHLLELDGLCELLLCDQVRF